ncbi:MAG: MFS transporter [Alphaproteobacteria bacterium]|nr:MFS transporter [Alphaproteobacteria bacterium]
MNRILRSSVTEAGGGAAAIKVQVAVKRTRWDVVALGIAAGVMIGVAVGKVPPAIGLISDEFTLDRVTAGWLASIFFAFGAVMGALTGFAGGRIGERMLLLAGLAVLAIGGAIGAASGSGGMLLALRVIEGFGFAAIAVAAPKLTVDAATEEDRDLALGIWSAYMPAGMALSMVLAPALLPAIGWRGMWLVGAAATVAVAVLAFAGTSRRRWPDQPARAANAPLDWAGARATVSRTVLWLYAGSFVLFTVQWFAIAAWLPTFLTETQGRSGLAAALFSALVVAVNVVGNVAGAWLLHRGVPRWLLIAAVMIIMAVTGALILGSFMPDDGKIPLAIIFSAGSGLLPAAAFSGAAVHAPKASLMAMANGIILQGAAVGMLAGPPLLAAVVGGLGSWADAWWTMLVCPAIGLGLAAGIYARERKRA